MSEPIPVNLPFPVDSVPNLTYCDYIASRALAGLSSDPDCLLQAVRGIKTDLHPTEGWFVSTKKTIDITDRNGKEYRITVEEV